MRSRPSWRAAAPQPTSCPMATRSAWLYLSRMPASLYIQHAVQSVEKQGIDFKGLKVALDTGHGASCMTSAEALRRLGADVTVINDDYCGTDINVQCGSTHLEPLRALVAECGADVGIAHDGDADRVMLMAPDGTEIDGDMVEAVCAIDLKQRGLLAGDAAVSTVMANLGLTHALRDAGINLIQTKVGDRYVLEAMREGGYVIGGESSPAIPSSWSTTPRATAWSRRCSSWPLASAPASPPAKRRKP